MPRKRFTTDELKTLASSPNIATKIKERDREAIGEMVVSDYEDDYGKAEGKKDKWKEVMDLVNQIKQEKNFPWPDASNIKFPIIVGSCIRFGAKIYPEIVQTGRIARVKVNGADPEGAIQQRATRVEDHLNYQITEEIDNWETDTDTLLALLPAYGCYYKKIYHSKILQRPVVDICNPEDIITSNCSNSLEQERRISHCIALSPNEIIERIRSGLFLDLAIDDNKDDEDNDEEFIEQHCFLDLDEDGYAEPYVVTAHKESKKVFRIVARFTEDDIKESKMKGKSVISRIDPFTHFVKYLFMPAFDGTTTGLGLGELLVPLNEQINTLINQLTDAGTLQNVQGGFIGKGIRMESGPFRIAMGEWMPVESRGGSLRDNIMELPTREPSQTLFALLGMMTETADALSASYQVAPGEIPMNTPATTLLALIEEGMKVYSSIHKRIQNSVKCELRKIYHLNRQFGDPDKYAEYHNDQVDMLADYAFRDSDISPVAGPEVSSDMQRMVKSQGLIDLAERQVGQAGGLDPRAVVQNYLESTRQSNIDVLQPPPPPPTDEVPLEQQMMELQAEIETGKIELKEKELDIKRMSEEVKARKTLAEAEAVEEGTQMDEYNSQVQDIKDGLEIKERQQALKERQEAQPAAPAVPRQPTQGQ